MFSFDKEQEVYDIDGVKFGGQPGDYPTVMVGSIFYEGHNIVEDQKKGLFDEDAAREEIRKAEELSEKTGNPLVLDVVGENTDSLIKYMDFVADETDVPFLLDGTTKEVRIPAAEHIKETGLEDRVIYNTISVTSDDEEIESIRESGIKSAVLLCFNPKLPTVDGRMQSLEKVIEMAEKAEIEKPLVDPSILDLPDPGVAGRVIYQTKEKYGLPSGCGAHNAVDQWREKREMPSDLFTLRAALANSFTIPMGADFSLFGPLNDAEEMFAACSLSDAYTAYGMKLGENRGPQTDDHPLNKIFTA